MGTRRSRKGVQAPPPDGQLRQSQIITTYGPGALVDLLDDAVMISGIDQWRYANELEAVIKEPRLYDALQSSLQARGIRLDPNAPFRRPPTTPDTPRKDVGIDAVQFPRWYVCPSCRGLQRDKQMNWSASQKRYHCSRDGCGKVAVTPVRFVLACERGHIEEFSWVRFVHRRGAANEQRCTTPMLRLVEGGVGDFAAITVECIACDARRPLLDAVPKDALPQCRGQRPWLAQRDHEEGCEERLKLLVRTATSAYFSLTETALTLPPDDADAAAAPFDAATASVDEIARRLRPELSAFEPYSVEELSTDFALKLVAKQVKVLLPYLPVGGERFADALTLARKQAEERQKGRRSAQPRTTLLLEEYERFTTAPPVKRGHAPSGAAETERTFLARRLDAPVPDGLERVVLAHKLRKVMALHGFTRLRPAPRRPVPGAHGAAPMPVGDGTDWLPAVEIFGEGVFFTLDRDRVEAWESREAVLLRARQMGAAYEAARPGETFPGIRYALLHTLSHALITSLATECGYAASALQERIYCSDPDADEWMAGVLIMTGSPGSQGTLGGLVAQGERLDAHLTHALEDLRICSHDPVCGSHTPSATAEPPNPDGAACHGCLYVPEPCCEAYNRLLDRALLVPVMGAPAGLAFYPERDP